MSKSQNKVCAVITNFGAPVKYYKSYIRACLDAIELSRKNPGKPIVVVDFALLSHETFISGEML